LKKSHLAESKKGGKKEGLKKRAFLGIVKQIGSPHAEKNGLGEKKVNSSFLHGQGMRKRAEREGGQPA